MAIDLTAYLLQIPNADGDRYFTVARTMQITGSTGERRIIHYDEKPGGPLDAFPYNLGVDVPVLQWAIRHKVKEIHYEQRGNRRIYILGVREFAGATGAAVMRGHRRVAFFPIARWDQYAGKRWYDLPGDSVHAVQVGELTPQTAVQGLLL